jgi:hypothetical protein
LESQLAKPENTTAQSKDHPEPLVRHLLREPLVAFMIMGVAIFALYGAVSPSAPVLPEAITLTAADVDRLKGQFRATWNREPTAEEFSALVAGYVDEEVLYREALLYGLDEDDPIVRVRLRQKAEFLLASPGTLSDPTEADLAAHYERTQSDYTVPAAVTFEQAFLGEASPENAALALTELRAGGDPDTVGSASLLPAEMDAARQTAVDSTFGNGFFAEVASAPLNQWSGPVASVFGVHLLRVSAVEQSLVPPFEEVRALVEADWRRLEGEKVRQAALETIKSRYRIDLSQVEGLK